MPTYRRSNLTPSRKDDSREEKECPCEEKEMKSANRNKLMINKKIMPIEKTKRTVFGIFGKFVADLFNMSFYFCNCRESALKKLAHSRQFANFCPHGQAAYRRLKGDKIRSIILKP
jgi:hypothetical protein